MSRGHDVIAYLGALGLLWLLVRVAAGCALWMWLRDVSTRDA
jgi:hypothetical protein